MSDLSALSRVVAAEKNALASINESKRLRGDVTPLFAQITHLQKQLAQAQRQVAELQQDVAMLKFRA